MILEVTEKQARMIKKILDEVVESPDGYMTFRKHFKSTDSSIEGWYAIKY